MELTTFDGPCVKLRDVRMIHGRLPARHRVRHWFGFTYEYPDRPSCSM